VASENAAREGWLVGGFAELNQRFSENASEHWPPTLQTAARKHAAHSGG
jgi:hypothetical protein